MSQTKLTSYFKKHAVIYPETFDMKKVNTFTKKENPSEIPLPRVSSSAGYYAINNLESQSTRKPNWFKRFLLKFLIGVSWKNN